jgi:hypothetical protein
MDIVHSAAESTGAVGDAVSGRYGLPQGSILRVDVARARRKRTL